MFKQLVQALRPADPVHKAVSDELTATVSQASQENSIAAKRVSDTLTSLFGGDTCPIRGIFH